MGHQKRCKNLILVNQCVCPSDVKRSYLYFEGTRKKHFIITLSCYTTVHYYYASFYQGNVGPSEHQYLIKFSPKQKNMRHNNFNPSLGIGTVNVLQRIYLAAGTQNFMKSDEVLI